MRTRTHRLAVGIVRPNSSTAPGSIIGPPVSCPQGRYGTEFFPEFKKIILTDIHMSRSRRQNRSIFFGKKATGRLPAASAIWKITYPPRVGHHLRPDIDQLLPQSLRAGIDIFVASQASKDTLP